MNTSFCRIKKHSVGTRMSYTIVILMHVIKCTRACKRRFSEHSQPSES